MNRILEHAEIEWSAFDKFEPIIDKYMPDIGEGDSLASQMVTAVNKLIYKWYNDGDVYDNNYALSGWVNDLSSFANWLYTYVKETRPILKRISKIKNEAGYEYILLALAMTVLTEDFLSKYSDKAKTGSIYRCDGPFSWVDLSEYDDEDEEDWYEEDYYEEDLEEDYKESKYSLSEIEDAVSTSFGFNKKETKDYIKKASPEVLDALVAGFKAGASKSFLTDDLKKKEPEIKLEDEDSKEIDEGEAVFTKKNGTPGYLVKDGGKEKFLRNYTEKQVKDLGFKIKKNTTEDILKEGFYEGGFPNFESFMEVVYEGETYGDYEVEFPHFSKTIDLIDSIWEEKYSDKDTWDQIPFTTEEKDKIFKAAQEEAEMWDNMDLYNSHARYNYASIKQIKAAIRDAFNVTNKYLHENLKEDYTPISLEDEIIRIVGDEYENGDPLYKNIEMLKDDFINSFDYDFSKVDFNSLWDLYNELHDMGPKSFFESFKDSAEYEYNGIQIFAVPLNNGLISVTGQWKEGGGKFGKARPDEKIYRTTNKNLAIKTYIDKYLKNFLDKNLKDIDKNPDAYWD